MSGVLYIVATPIGNLDDITVRAIKTLGEVDRIAAEDTRHSGQLLAHLGIKKPMLSLHEHNERERIEQVIDLLQQGENIALVSDAGTPLISDPGYPLVNAVVAAELKVVPIPGVSSIITALSAAGLPTDKFTYYGFLPHKSNERLHRLEALKDQTGTLVLLEATHRIEKLLIQMAQVMPSSQIVLAKELTKRFENFIRGNAQHCLDMFKQDEQLKKGEFVVLIHHGALEDTVQAAHIESQRLLRLLLAEMSLKKAVAVAAEITGIKKNSLYKEALSLSEQL